jgi:acyl-homoserine-lactone acylase
MHALAVLLLLAAADPAAERMARTVTIHRDTWGVPHIYAPTDAAAVFGLMYAQAEDNFWQIERTYIRALGRLAEIEGPAALRSDLMVRLFEVVERARAEYDRASADTRAICDAFAAGLNYWLAKNPKVKPALITRFEPWHILAWQRGTGTAGLTPAEVAREFPSLAGVPPPDPPAEGEEDGSNMWALAPSRTALGRALLLINPHVGFFGGGQRYEAHLEGDRLSVSGFAILGSPYIRSGFTRRHGWSLTNNYADTADAYLERFDDPADPLVYRYGDTRRRASIWTADILVKNHKGVEMRRFRLRKTHHGPILGIRDGKPVAVRAAAAELEGVMEQRLAMARARDLDEFRAALARRAMTGSNTMYADRQGNIFYVHGNAVPRRDPHFPWNGAVDGADPATEWQGYHDFGDLPQILNPPAGYLQNCNSTPFLATANAGLDPARYPKYMVPEEDTPRARNSRRLLDGDRKFTYEGFILAALDTTLIAAVPLERLFTAFAKLREVEPERAEALSAAIEELARWDHVAANSSVATTLFVRWSQELGRARGAALPEIAALEGVLRRLSEDFGDWRVGWGEVNRLQRIHTSGTEEQFSDERPSLPVPGAPGTMGSLFVVNTRTPAGARRGYAISGNTYVAALEFGDRLRSRSLLVFGQSADPASKHHFDQASLYSSKQLKPAWFYRGDVRRHTARRYRPGD